MIDEINHNKILLERRISSTITNYSKSSILNFFIQMSRKIETRDLLYFFYKKTIYRKIYIFVSRINDYIHLIDKIIVRDNLSLCLRKIIIIWYLKKIDDFKRKTFKNLFLIDFINELKKRFKIRIVKILNKLIIEIYIVKNVKKNEKQLNFCKILFFIFNQRA